MWIEYPKTLLVISSAAVIGIFAANSWSIEVNRSWFDAVSMTNKLSVVKILKNNPKIEKDIKNHRSARWLPIVSRATPRKTAIESTNETRIDSGAAIASFVRPAIDRCRLSMIFRNAKRMSEAVNMIMNHWKIGADVLRDIPFFNVVRRKIMKTRSSEQNG